LGLLGRLDRVYLSLALLYSYSPLHIVLQWALHRKTLIDKLFVAQKAVRLITNSKLNAHSEQVFSKFSILTVYQLTDLQIGYFVNNIIPSQLCDTQAVLWILLYIYIALVRAINDIVNVAYYVYVLTLSDIMVFYYGTRWLMLFILRCLLNIENILFGH